MKHLITYENYNENFYHNFFGYINDKINYDLYWKWDENDGSFLLTDEDENPWTNFEYPYELKELIESSNNTDNMLHHTEYVTYMNKLSNFIGTEEFAEWLSSYPKHFSEIKDYLNKDVLKKYDYLIDSDELGII
jgi:hypothetical protein